MIRAYTPQDAEATSAVWLRAGREEYVYLPTFQALNEASALKVFRQMIVPPNDIYVFTLDGLIAGFLAIQGSYIDRLYVDPPHQRRGIGVALLKHAMELSPAGLELHTHQQNRKARDFYEKFGFFPVKFGVSPEPESAPDVEYHWRN